METLVKTYARLVLNEKSDILGSHEVLDACKIGSSSIGRVGSTKTDEFVEGACRDLPSADVSIARYALPSKYVCGSVFV